jgi:peptide deformylase
MIYPIVAYGDPILRKVTRPIEKEEVDIHAITQNMFETMYNASGVGLAAPQVGLDIRLFVVDGSPMADDEDELEEGEEPENPELVGFKKVFINPEIIEETGEKWAFEEGCLSIPGLRGDVMRPANVKIRYRDENWEEHEETFTGIAARIIQHEYDHLEGKLFVDYLPALKKQMIKKKLTNISKGIVDADYRMKFPHRK